MVALQSYLFSAALSRVGIPHRVMSYCTYGDHTVLRRFRDYDDRPEHDRKILEYRATANNRDGLALAAAGIDLLRRKEEHKIVIVFSDGLPNDMVSGRVRPGMPKKYVGDEAVRDTCAQVRKLRRAGAHVIGIFLGDDGELENERLIYGASLLRIRRAEDFGGTAGKRLSETLLQL
jgi:nitric oxide reductase activation protein